MQKTALALNYTHVGRESSSREGVQHREREGRQGRQRLGEAADKVWQGTEQQEKAQTRRRDCDCDKLILQYFLPVLVSLCLPPLTALSPSSSADFLSAFNGTFCQ